MDEDNFDRIKFKHPLAEQELMKLFRYFREGTSRRIDYQGELIGKIGLEEPIEGKDELEERVISRGAIHFEDNHRWLNFRLSYDLGREERNIAYTEIQFDIPPGYKRRELVNSPCSNPADMDLIRTSVSNYFSQFLI